MKFPKVFGLLGFEFLHSGHLQSLGAMGIVYVSTVLSPFRSLSWDCAVAVYLLFQSIFYFDRYLHQERDSSTNKERSAHFKKYGKTLPYIIAGLIAVMLFIVTHYSNLQALLFSVFVLVAGFMYPLFLKDLTRKIFIFKNIYVSAVFALIAIYPLIYYKGPVALLPIALVFLVFMESLVNQIALDIKDLESDMDHGLLTLPAKYGDSGTLRFLFVVSFILFVAILIYWASFGYNLQLLVLSVINLGANLFGLLGISRNKKAGYLSFAAKFSLWLPGIFIFK